MILCSQHVRLTDDHCVGIHPDKVVRVDREQLLLPTLPKEGQRLLLTPLPAILSEALARFRLWDKGVRFGAPAALVRDRNVDVVGSAVGHPDHLLSLL